MAPTFSIENVMKSVIFYSVSLAQPLLFCWYCSLGNSTLLRYIHTQKSKCVLKMIKSVWQQVHPLFILSVADFILAILWLIGGVVWLNPDSNGWATNASDPHTGMCYVLAISTTVRKPLQFY